MSAVEWGPYEPPGCLRDRCAFVGVMKPPRRIAERLDDDGRRALDELALLLLAANTIALVMHHRDISIIVEQFNASLDRHRQRGGSDWRWTVPQPTKQGLYEVMTMRRHGRDRLGLDVPAAWGADWLATYYGAKMLLFRERRGCRTAAGRMREAHNAAYDLADLLRRAIGCGWPATPPIPTITIDAAWQRLERALSWPETEILPSRIIMTREAWNRTRLRPVTGGRNGTDAV